MTTRRIFLAALILGSITLLGQRAAPSGTPLATTVVEAAPAAIQTSEMQFSTEVRDNAQPVDPRVEFSSDTPVIWASFDFHDADPNAKLSYIVRANGEDYLFGDLDKPFGKTDGRFAFPIERRSGNDLPGAAYDVFVYANSEQIARGGFGVKGRQGLDNDGSGDNGNDNH